MNLVTREQWENCFLDKQCLCKISSLSHDLKGFWNDPSAPEKIPDIPCNYSLSAIFYIPEKLHPLSWILLIMFQHILYWYVECNNIIINHIIFLVFYTTASLQQEHWGPQFLHGTWEHGLKYAQQYTHRSITTDIIDPSLRMFLFISLLCKSLILHSSFYHTVCYMVISSLFLMLFQ